MTVNDLIAELQQLTDEQRRREAYTWSLDKPVPMMSPVAQEREVAVYSTHWLYNTRVMVIG